MQNNANGTVKDIIADALVEIIKEKSIEDITVAELTSRAGVSKSSFYRNFHDIYNVFEYLSDNFVKKACNIMLSFVFNADIELVNLPESIDFNVIKVLLGFSDADTAFVNYLFSHKNSKVFRAVVKLFVDTLVSYAEENNLDVAAVEFYTRFVANGIYYSALSDYITDGKLDMKLVKILKLFNIFDMKGGE